jgi:hypothetical protein
MGRHRAPPPNYAARRIGAAVVVLAVLGGLLWFFFLRDGDDGDGTETSDCATYRASLLGEYRPLRRLQAQLIEALAPVDADEEMSEEQIARARSLVGGAQARYEAIDELRGPPEQLRQDYVSLRPSLNEFVALARRTVEWLEGTLPGQPTETPSAQLQSLYDFITPPNAIASC